MALRSSHPSRQNVQGPPTPPFSSDNDDPNLGVVDVDKVLDDTIKFLQVDHAGALPSSAVDKPSMHAPTPEHSTPATSIIDIGQTHSSRVLRFAPETDWAVHESPGHPGTENINPLRPSKDRIPKKSILKPFSPSQFNAAPPPLIEMLQSIIGHLASGDRATRHDAYVSSVYTMHRFQDVPDRQLLKDKCSVLLKFIQRDVRPLEPGGAVDTQTVVAALSFFKCLLKVPGVYSVLDPQGCISVLDCTIHSLRDPNSQKAAVNTCITFLVEQTFDSKVMTPHRVDQILEAVRNIQERIPGDSIRHRQLLLYRKLCQQAPQIMVSRAGPGDWLEHIYNAMTSNKNQVLREEGIDLGRAAALACGSWRGVSKALEKLFKEKRPSPLAIRENKVEIQETAKSKTYRDLVVESLAQASEKEELAPSVPRICAVTSLFLRASIQNAKGDLEILRPWLLFFNKRPNAARRVLEEGYRAWNIITYCVSLNTSTVPKTRELLLVALEQRLRISQDGTFSKGLTRHCFSSYLCLLYYALRPGAPSKQLDLYWDLYVNPIISKISGKQGTHAVTACRVLTSLFTPSQIWNELRCVEPALFEIDDLPCLDSFWVRANLPRISGLLQRLFKSPEVWLSTESDAEPPAVYLWTILLNTIARAGAKEVTLSADLKVAMAHCIRLLDSTWSYFQQELETSIPHSTEIYTSMVHVLLNELGANSLVERNPIENPKQVNSSTTTKRLLKLDFKPNSPITFLLNQQVSSSLPHDAVQSRTNFITNTVQRCWDSRPTKSLKLDLLCQLSQCLYIAQRKGRSPLLLNTVSSYLLNLLKSTIGFGKNAASNPTDRERTFEMYTQVLSHLLPCIAATEFTKGIYEAIVQEAREIGGAGGLLIAVTEPHASMISALIEHSQCYNNTLIINYAHLVLSHHTTPRNRRDIWKGKMSLMGNSAPISDIFEQRFNKLPSMVNICLIFCYEHLSSIDLQCLSRFFGALARHLALAETTCRVFLGQIKDGLSCFATDPERSIRNLPSGEGRVAFLEQLLSLWQAISTALLDSPVEDWLSPELEDLVTASLCSSNAAVSKSIVEVFNKSTHSGVTYPRQLSNALYRVRYASNIHISGILHPLTHRSEESIVYDPGYAMVDISKSTGMPHAEVTSEATHRPNIEETYAPEPDKQQIAFNDIEIEDRIPQSSARDISEVESSPASYRDAVSSPKPTEPHLLGERDPVALPISNPVKAAEMFPDIDTTVTTRSLCNAPHLHLLPPTLDADTFVPSSDPPDPPTTPTGSRRHGGEEDDESPSPIVASERRRQTLSRREMQQREAPYEPPLDIPSSPPDVARQSASVVMESYIEDHPDVIIDSFERDAREQLESESRSTEDLQVQKGKVNLEVSSACASACAEECASLGVSPGDSVGIEDAHAELGNQDSRDRGEGGEGRYPRTTQWETAMHMVVVSEEGELQGEASEACHVESGKTNRLLEEAQLKESAHDQETSRALSLPQPGAMPNSSSLPARIIDQPDTDHSQPPKIPPVSAAQLSKLEAEGNDWSLNAPGQLRPNSTKASAIEGSFEGSFEGCFEDVDWANITPATSPRGPEQQNLVVCLQYRNSPIKGPTAASRDLQESEHPAEPLSEVALSLVDPSSAALQNHSQLSEAHTHFSSQSESQSSCATSRSTQSSRNASRRQRSTKRMPTSSTRRALRKAVPSTLPFSAFLTEGERDSIDVAEASGIDEDLQATSKARTKRRMKRKYTRVVSDDESDVISHNRREEIETPAPHVPDRPSSEDESDGSLCGFGSKSKRHKNDGASPVSPATPESASNASRRRPSLLKSPAKFSNQVNINDLKDSSARPSQAEADEAPTSRQLDIAVREAPQKEMTRNATQGSSQHAAPPSRTLLSSDIVRTLPKRNPVLPSERTPAHRSAIHQTSIFSPSALRQSQFRKTLTQSERMQRQQLSRDAGENKSAAVSKKLDNVLGKKAASPKTPSARPNRGDGMMTLRRELESGRTRSDSTSSADIANVTHASIEFDDEAARNTRKICANFRVANAEDEPLQAMLKRDKRRASPNAEDSIRDNPYPPKRRRRNDGFAVAMPTPGRPAFDGRRHAKSISSRRATRESRSSSSECESGGFASARSSLRQVEEGAGQDSPRSIVSGLNRILERCKNMAFGPREQREIDDVLFHVRKTVFENSREEGTTRRRKR